MRYCADKSSRSGHRSPSLLPAIAAGALIAAALLLLTLRCGVAWWVSYLIAINLATFAIYGYDKTIAGGQKTRVPEKFLHLLAFCGGSPAAIAGQRLWRHKTRKRSMQFWSHAIVLLQILIIVATILFLWRTSAGR